ncbi:hypothetical protein [Noviherbaspirillum pedocola]|uniref:Uncharacterized protein n=1 Tax=Noviherbaspirillum pedocola TaxID=2801341 RepID=A0A934SQF3_9BURK|nr:hypothetical protein [Noviherbaspirillum pedocola]MBK4733595.1 hypothetical protein [Noviherbaspirillum pedocola]
MAMQGANNQATQVRSSITLATDAGKKASGSESSTSSATPVVGKQGGTVGGGFMQSATAQPGATLNSAPTTTTNPRYTASSATASRAKQFENKDGEDEVDAWQEKRLEAARNGDRKAYEKAVKESGDDIRESDQLLACLTGESELDLAILAGSKKTAKALSKAGFKTSSWAGLDDNTLAQLPKVFDSKNEAELEKAMSKSVLEMNQLVTANTGTELLVLACRIDSPKLAEAWIKAHPKSLQSQRLGNAILQRTELHVPIRAGSMAITKLMLELGAIPGLMDIAMAQGQIKELLQRTYDALPSEQRYE